MNCTITKVENSLLFRFSNLADGRVWDETSMNLEDVNSDYDILNKVYKVATNGYRDLDAEKLEHLGAIRHALSRSVAELSIDFCEGVKNTFCLEWISEYGCSMKSQVVGSQITNANISIGSSSGAVEIDNGLDTESGLIMMDILLQRIVKTKTKHAIECLMNTTIRFENDSLEASVDPSTILRTKEEKIEQSSYSIAVVETGRE